MGLGRPSPTSRRLRAQRRGRSRPLESRSESLPCRTTTHGSRRTQRCPRVAQDPTSFPFGLASMSSTSAAWSIPTVLVIALAADATCPCDEATIHLTGDERLRQVVAERTASCEIGIVLHRTQQDPSSWVVLEKIERESSISLQGLKRQFPILQDESKKGVIYVHVGTRNYFSSNGYLPTSEFPEQLEGCGDKKAMLFDMR